MSTRSHTLRNTMFSTVGLYTEFALGMLVSIVIARHLGPHTFGAYSGVIWLMAMGVAIANAGTASAAIKFIAELRGSGREAQVAPLLAYLRRMQRRFLLLVLAAAVLVLLFAGHEVAPSLDAWIVLGFLLATIPLRAAYMFNVGTAKGFENFRANAMVALAAAPANLLLVLLVALLDLSVYWQLGAFFASSVLFWALSRRRIAPLTRDLPVDAALQPDLAPRVRHHVLYSALTVGVAFVVNSEAEVFFLNLYNDEHGAGLFKVAYQLATGAAALVPGVFGALLLPIMAGALSHGAETTRRKFVASTTYLVLLAAPLAAFGAVFADTLVHVLYGREYWEAGPLLAYCLLATAFTAASMGASSLLIGADRQRSVLVVTLASGVLKVGLDATLIHAYGVHGAVAAFTTVSVFQACALLVLGMRSSGAVLEWGRVGRATLAAVLAGLVVLPLREWLTPLADLVIGAPAFAVLYLALSLLLGCWSRGDIEHLQHLQERHGARRGVGGRRLLAWAHARAHQEAAP
jgi:O-antigen/teichoic acid export membrane protein